MPSRRDVRMGRVPPRTIENGAAVAPGLQVNELTLQERQGLNALTRRRPLSRDEAARLYEPEEVTEVFG